MKKIFRILAMVIVGLAVISCFMFVWKVEQKARADAPKTQSQTISYLAKSIYNHKGVEDADTMVVIETKQVDIGGIIAEWVILGLSNKSPYVLQVPKLSVYGDLPPGTLVLVDILEYEPSYRSGQVWEYVVITPLKD